MPFKGIAFLPTTPPLEAISLQWNAPSPSDLRSPCPGLNILANHGYISHSGRKISKEDLLSALMSVYHFSPLVARFLVHPVVFRDGTFDLDELNVHDFIEHDSSTTRMDAFLGSNYELDEDLLNGLIEASSDGKVLTLEDYAHYQVKRQSSSIHNNPEFTFGHHQKFISSGEPPLIFSVFGEVDFESGKHSIPLPVIKTVFGVEKLPDNFSPPKDQIGAIQMLRLLYTVRSVWSDDWEKEKEKGKI